MGRMSSDLDKSGFVRMLTYGPPKSRKTWWALKAAELGFNVTLFDLDDGAAIARNLSPAALERIYRVDMKPNASGYDTSGAAALAYAMSGQVVFFDEAERRYTPRAKLQPEKPYLKIDLTAFTERDVIIIDTWTAFVQQLTANTVVVNNPTAVAKLEWEDYQKVRLLLDHFLTGALKLNCHLIVIGHSETYAKRKPDADPKDKPKDAIESVRLQPTSVTRAHAETMAGKFNDVLYFEIPNAMQGTTISTKGSEDFDAGSRIHKPGVFKFDDFDIATFFPPAHIEAVKNNMEFSSAGIQTVTKEQLDAERGAQPAASITVGAKPTTINLKRNT